MIRWALVLTLLAAVSLALSSATGGHHGRLVLVAGLALVWIGALIVAAARRGGS